MACEINESMFNSFVMSNKGEGMKCGAMEGAQHNILRWFSHTERMADSDMTKKIYEHGGCGGCKGMTYSEIRTKQEIM